MTTPFVGEIQIFGFNFAPAGWAFCDGSLLQIRQYSALFSLLGTAYGGDGVNTFGLPNFANRVGCSQGQGPGLSQRTMGETDGSNGVALTSNEIPMHNHLVTIFGQNDNTKRSGTPQSNYYLSNPHNSSTNPYGPMPANATFSPVTLGSTGSNQPHENRQPALALNFCIALQGAFPSFN
jgi:microcystin-dependent protein